jgi:pimeloyl-ACP methyl ester carboxylesterase
MTHASPAPDGAVNRMVQAPGGRIHISDHPGQDPALVLLHGFPDDSRIYDRLVLQLDRVVLVGHDAGGPDAIDYTLREPGRVDQLILLDTYYGHASMLRLPEAIRLLADPELRPLADALLEDPALRLWLLGHTALRFGLDPDDPGGVAVTAVAPQFFGDGGPPRRAGRGARLDRGIVPLAGSAGWPTSPPVTWRPWRCRSRWCSAPPTTTSTPDLARQLAGLFRHADLHLVQGASHWPQWDQPELVARLIIQAAASDPGALLP